jgi:hypothetical protein
VKREFRVPGIAMSFRLWVLEDFYFFYDTTYQA